VLWQLWLPFSTAKAGSTAVISGWWNGRAGPASIRDFLVASIMAQPGHSRLVATRANGQLAFGHYRLDPATGRYLAHSLDILTLRAELIAEITAVVRPGAFGRFGLSSHLLQARSGSN
jgi:hypothetical protein